MTSFPGPANRRRFLLRPHVEGVELQDERRRHQLRIIRFFDRGVIFLRHDGFGLRFEASVVD
jgi:hypothetical protein